MWESSTAKKKTRMRKTFNSYRSSKKILFAKLLYVHLVRLDNASYHPGKGSVSSTQKPLISALREQFTKLFRIPPPRKTREQFLIHVPSKKRRKTKKNTSTKKYICKGERAGKQLKKLAPALRGPEITERRFIREYSGRGHFSNWSELWVADAPATRHHRELDWTDRQANLSPLSPPPLMQQFSDNG